MAYVKQRRRFVASRAALLGDPWSDYLATGGGPSGGTIVSPDGDVLHFDSNGLIDYTTPAPRTDSTVERDPSSTFYGWTTQQVNAYWAGQGVTGIATDAVKNSAVVMPGDTVATVDPAVVAASDANLRNIAATDPKVAAALETLKTGAFRGAQQAAFDAQNAANLLQDAQNTLDDWNRYRTALINAGEPGATDLPVMPPVTFTGTLDADMLADLQALAAKQSSSNSTTVPPLQVPKVTTLPVPPSPQVLTPATTSVLRSLLPASRNITATSVPVAQQLVQPVAGVDVAAASGAGLSAKSVLIAAGIGAVVLALRKH